MAIEVRTIRGTCAGKLQDSSVDGIYLVDASNRHYGGDLVGIADRRKGAAVNLIAEVSESVVGEIRQALDARDFEDLPLHWQKAAAVREVIDAPPVVVEEVGEDDE